MINRILITGGAGMVGHHFCEHFLKNTDAEIVILDRLSYSSNGYEKLRDINAYRDNEERVTILSGDFTLPLSEGTKQEIGDVDYIFHIGAESHVDRSIDEPTPFVKSNVEGTMHVLNFARELQDKGVLKCFFYFSTDEVFGPAPEGMEYKENDRHNPTNPYAATKSGGEMLVKSYRNTYKLPAIITRSMNIFGERQHPEKFIPLVINKVIDNETVTIHSNSDKTKAGSRFYIHARNVADGYLFLIRQIESKAPIIGQDFHITGEEEVDNLDLAKMVTDCIYDYYLENEQIERPNDLTLKTEMTDFHSQRPGHDLRYALSGEKLAKIGWTPKKQFKDSLKKTVYWFIDNPKWLNY